MGFQLSDPTILLIQKSVNMIVGLITKNFSTKWWSTSYDSKNQLTDSYRVRQWSVGFNCWVKCILYAWRCKFFIIVYWRELLEYPKRNISTVDVWRGYEKKLFLWRYKKTVVVREIKKESHYIVRSKMQLFFREKKSGLKTEEMTHLVNFVKQK